MRILGLGLAWDIQRLRLQKKKASYWVSNHKGSDDYCLLRNSLVTPHRLCALGPVDWRGFLLLLVLPPPIIVLPLLG